MRTVICIPCRLNSTRLPGKMLERVSGDMPLIGATYWNARKAADKLGCEVVVITDSSEIHGMCRDEGINSVIHEVTAVSGTQRIANAVKAGIIQGDHFINLQGDEPLFEPDNISRFIRFSRFFNHERCTAVKDGGNVWVRMKGPYAVEFSRTKKTRIGHIGIYSYSEKFLKGFQQPHVLSLEQTSFLPLRAIHLTTNSFGIDTPEDLQRIRGIK